MRDENGEVGRVVSFLINPSGQVVEALIESRKRTFLRHPIEGLKIGREGVFLTSDIEKRADFLLENLPKAWKRREILDKLSENNEILPDIYQTLCAEFDKALADMRSEAQSLVENIENQVKDQEYLIRELHLARTFLEIEHGIGSLEHETYKQCLVSILREIENASTKKANLLKIKDKVSDVLLGGEEAKLLSGTKEQSEAAVKHAEEEPVITVRMTQE